MYTITYGISKPTGLAIVLSLALSTQPPSTWGGFTTTGTTAMKHEVEFDRILPGSADDQLRQQTIRQLLPTKVGDVFPRHCPFMGGCREDY